MIFNVIIVIYATRTSNDIVLHYKCFIDYVNATASNMPVLFDIAASCTGELDIQFSIQN